jgi:PAS domain S-box-containing protein
LLIENLVNYTIVTLSPDGCVADWNTGARRITGYERADIIGRHFAAFSTEEDQREGEPERALVAASIQGRCEAEGWRVRKDRSRFWAGVVIEPIRRYDSGLFGFAMILRDNDEQRALEQAREQLHQVQKTKTVGQLRGGVAHDFNNLLMAISSSLELISGLAEDARVRRLIATAQRATERGAKLTSQLLAFSRRQILQPETANLNSLIVVFQQLLMQAGGEQIHLHVDLEPELWFCDVDPAQFQSALLNLVGNARDAMPQEGRLTIETRNVQLKSCEAAQFHEMVPGAYVVVAIGDTGGGMSRQVQARAIEPFFTTKDVGVGSGLGLSQVYGFARQSNGALQIDSQLGRGTTVRLYLPRSAGLAQRSGDQRPRAECIILVVEHDLDVLDIATETLQTFDYEVIAATTAGEALTILQRDVPIDILFTDVVMPSGMDGVQLAYEATRLRPAMRVLLASGYPRETLRRRTGLTDGMPFIAKPYSVPQLVERLGALAHLS